MIREDKHCSPAQEYKYLTHSTATYGSTHLRTELFQHDWPDIARDTLANMSNTTPPVWVQVHQANTWAYGPLPPLVDVFASSDQKTPQYTIKLKKGTETISLRSSHHPFSPEGKEEWDSVLPKIPQHPQKSHIIGISHPITAYQPHQWVWGESDTNFRRPLLKALQMSGVAGQIQNFENQSVVAAVKQLFDTIKPELYHPKDRVYALYPGEHQVSSWARYLKRSLVIIAPELDAKKPAWGSYNNPLATQRTEVRPRYSTGVQDEYRPIFLGCLSRNGGTETKWFALTPSPSFQELFQEQWQEYVFMEIDK